MIKYLFEDITKYLPSKLIPFIVSFLALPIITRLFSPAEYGNYVLIISSVYILSSITSWVNTSILRFYPAYEKGQKTNVFIATIIKLTFLSILVIFIISFCILLLVKSFISENLCYLMSIGLIVFISTSFFSIALDFLRIKRNINWFSVFFVWKCITTLVFGIMFVVIFDFGVDGLLWGAILSVGLSLPLLWKIAIGKIRLKSKSISLKSTIEMAKYSFPLVIGGLAAWILNLSDRYILNFFKSENEVGIYSISYIISEHSIMILVSLFSMAFNPLAIIIWEKEGKESSQRFLTEGTRYFLILCVPAIVGISVLRDHILNMLSTKDYYEGAKIIPFVVLGLFFFGLYQRFGAGLSFYKKTYQSMICVIASGLLNLVLNFLLIPQYGYLGAAITTLVSYAFLLILIIFVSRRFFVWEFPFKTLGRVVFASAIMGIFVYYIGNSLTSSNVLNLILAICSGMFIYFILLFLLKEIELIEAKKLLAIILKR